MFTKVIVGVSIQDVCHCNLLLWQHSMGGHKLWHRHCCTLVREKTHASSRLCSTISYCAVWCMCTCAQWEWKRSLGKTCQITSKRFKTWIKNQTKDLRPEAKTTDVQRLFFSGLWVRLIHSEILSHSELGIHACYKKLHKWYCTLEKPEDINRSSLKWNNTVLWRV